MSRFHHEFCKASDNEIVLSLWEALARRINIIFGREIASKRNFQVVISQHEKLIALFETGDPNIEDAIQSHILRLHQNLVALSTHYPRQEGHCSLMLRMIKYGVR